MPVTDRTDRRPDRVSLWQATSQRTPTARDYPALSGDVRTDIVVVGAGISGLTAALLGIERGRDVVVLDSHQVASGSTGGTTGKVTAQHGAMYADLLDRHDSETARAYAALNGRAIDVVRRLDDAYGLDGELTPATAYLFARNEDEVATARRELEASHEVGLAATWEERTELPFDVAGAVALADQLQINAVTYCLGLAATIDRTPGSAVHGDSHVLAVDEDDDGVIVRTRNGTVRADHAILATLAPLTDRGGETLRQRPVASYGVALEALDSTHLPEHVYTSAGEPLRSIRHYHGADRAFLVVVGETHDVGPRGGTAHHVETLESWARERWELGELAYSWRAQDQVPADRLPFVGRTAFSDRIHVITGLQKWGLTNGTWGAELVIDLMDGVARPEAEVFAPTRSGLSGGVRDAMSQAARVVTRFVGDRLAPDVPSVDAIPAGGGATVRIGGTLCAVSRDGDGQLRACEAACTHMGCPVTWNDTEGSWDCACHGSRFDRDGQVLAGPATDALRRVALASDDRPD